MNIVFKRHYKLLVLLVVLMIALFSVGETRVISYNFGEGADIKNYSQVNYENDIYLFDDSIIHEISIDLSQEDYENMVKLYQETGEKEYYKTNVTIDGVTVYNVGVRLKGNLTLSQTIGGNNSLNKGEFAGNMPERIENMENQAEVNDFFDFKEEFVKAEEENFEDMQFPENMQFPQDGGFEEADDDSNKNPPFLIKIDEFVEGQTYQGFAEIAVRIGSDESLLAEPIAFYIHQQIGQIVPQTSYAVVETAENNPSLYVLCEHIDEKYVQKHFSESDGILYKAGNFTGFEYLGDDPTLYSEKFEQKTGTNDDDLSQLIQFMKFVSQSNDEEFEKELGDWIDLESFIRMMALDNLLSNSDSFVGMGSNYYLYFNKDTQQFTILSWDMNLAMGSMMGGMGGDRKNNIEEDDTRIQKMKEWMEEAGVDMDEMKNFGQKMDNKKGNFMGGSNSTNLLKERFFENETFSKMYDEEYARLEGIIFSQNFVIEKIEELAQTFTEYNTEHNIIDQSLYDSGVENIKSFVQQKLLLTD